MCKDFSSNTMHVYTNTHTPHTYIVYTQCVEEKLFLESSRKIKRKFVFFSTSFVQRESQRLSCRYLRMRCTHKQAHIFQDDSIYESVRRTFVEVKGKKRMDIPVCMFFRIRYVDRRDVNIVKSFEQYDSSPKFSLLKFKEEDFSGSLVRVQ